MRAIGGVGNWLLDTSRSGIAHDDAQSYVRSHLSPQKLQSPRLILLAS